MKHLFTLLLVFSAFYARSQCTNIDVSIAKDSVYAVCGSNQTSEAIFDVYLNNITTESDTHFVKVEYPDGEIKELSTTDDYLSGWTIQPGMHKIVEVKDNNGCVTSTDVSFDIPYVPAQRAVMTSSGDFCAGDDHAVVTLEIFPKTDVEMTYYGYLYSQNGNSQGRQFDFTGSKDTFHVDQPGEYFLEYIESSVCNVDTRNQQASTTVKGTFCYDLELIHPSCDNDDGGFRITNTVSDDIYKEFKVSIESDTLGADTLEVLNLSSGKYTLALTPKRWDELWFYTEVEIDLRKGGLEYTISEEMPACEEGNGSIAVNGLSVPEEDILWSNGETGSSIENLYPGLYELVVLDNADMCHDTTQVLLKDSCSEQNFATIAGKVFNDVNGDGYKSNEEPYLASKYVYVTPGNYYAFTNQQGEYSIKVPLGLDYELYIEPGYKYSCSGRFYNQADISFPVDGNYEGLDLTVKGQQIDKDFGLIIEEKCVTISGFVFDDEDANGNQDAGEKGMRGARIFIENETENISTYALTDDMGNFSIEVPESTSDYTVSLSLTNNQYYFCSGTYKDVQTYPATEGDYTFPTTDIIEFGVDREDAFDVGVVSVRMHEGTTPGKVFNSWMDFKANGNIDEDCSLRLNHDEHVSFINAMLPPDVVTDDYIEWNFNQYSIPSGYCNNMRFQLAANTPANYNLVYTAEYTCESEDACPNNNTMTRTFRTVGPTTFKKAEASSLVDVNIQTYAMGDNASGEIAEGDTVLSYTINFKNIGKDTLYHLTIRDTLPENLQFGKVSKGFSSEEYKFSFLEPNILQWEFSNLSMPGSYVNELESYGFVQFNIITEPLSYGDAIEKEVAVTFNEKKTVKAASVLNVTKTTSLDDQFAKAEDMMVYPNPSNGLVTVQSNTNTIDEIVVNDVTGMEVKRFTKVGAKSTNVNLNDLQSGVYIIQVHAEKEMKTYKIVVQ